MEVYVHGGVSGAARRARDLSSAVAAGRSATSALEAVERAVRELEDDPELNAGYGAVLNDAGELELDAGIADGSSGATGAVAGVAVRHPISLARAVLERTPHVLLAGAGAARLGAELGLELLEDTTPAQRARWRETIRRKAEGVSFGAPEHVDTVGAVALDEDGRLAAGSSTGGVAGQWPGRVGDSPLFGAGFFASGSAAVVGTGVGELFVETLACLRAGLLMEQGASPPEACEKVITLVTSRRPEAAAGLLALDSKGRAGAAYRGESWPVAGNDGAPPAVRLGPVSSR